MPDVRVRVIRPWMAGSDLRRARTSAASSSTWTRVARCGAGEAATASPKGCEQPSAGGRGRSTSIPAAAVGPERWRPWRSSASSRGTAEVRVEAQGGERGRGSRGPDGRRGGWGEDTKGSSDLVTAEAELVCTGRSGRRRRAVPRRPHGRGRRLLCPG